MESFPHTKFTISTSYSLWLQVLMCVFSICSKVSVNAPPSSGTGQIEGGAFTEPSLQLPFSPGKKYTERATFRNTFYRQLKLKLHKALVRVLRPLLVHRQCKYHSATQSHCVQQCLCRVEERREDKLCCSINFGPVTILTYRCIILTGMGDRCT